jgi:hypothetical protein
LPFGQSQSRHFEELALDAPEHFIVPAGWLGRHRLPPKRYVAQGRTQKEQPICQSKVLRSRSSAAETAQKQARILDGLIAFAAIGGNNVNSPLNA